MPKREGAALEQYNKRLREYMKERRRKRHAEAIRILGGMCATPGCGATEDLQIDHIDPGQKTFNFGRRYDASWDLWLEELKKCQALCQRHHAEKTIYDHGHTPTKGVHGKADNYAHYGCRCDLCRKANAKRTNEYKHRKGIFKSHRRGRPPKSNIGD